MSKVTNQLNNIIRTAGWAKAFADMDDVMKYKKITGVDWVNKEYMTDADNEAKLLWMIASGHCFPKVAGDEAPRPDATPNTPEQNAIQEDIEEKIKNGSTKITFEGTANNITIPAEATKSVTITGEFQDGFTITNLSKKNPTVKNTGKAVDVIIDSDSSVLYLSGEYKNVHANVPYVYATNARMNKVVFDSSLEGKGDISVYADWNSPATVESYNTNNISIANASDDKVLEGLAITAPNATVTLNGEWGDVIATTGNDTLYILPATHIKKLTVKKGNVRVYNCNLGENVDTVEIAEGSTYESFRYHVPADGTKLTGKPGIYYIDEDTTGTLSYGISRIGNYRYINNAKLTSTDSSALMLITSRMSAILEGGEWHNNVGYGVWVSNEDAKVVVKSGKYTGNTHSMYAEKGTIEIEGGEFDLADTTDYKYLLNCYDANYKEGTARIIVKGGKFHKFNPAASMSEPNGPVSFLAEGYKSVRTAEDIWEVFPQDAEVTEWTAPEETTESAEPAEKA